MYTIVKCTWCTEIIVISQDQLYFICPVCGCSCRSETSTPYLHCEQRTVAIAIALELGKFLQDRAMKELTPEEIEQIQKEYSAYSNQHPYHTSMKTRESIEQEEKSMVERPEEGKKKEEKRKRKVFDRFFE